MTAAAAVSKATFYRNFDGLPGCILATFELAAKNVLAVVERGCRDDGDDGPDLGAILSVVLAFFEAEPALACVLTDGALDDVPGLPAARAEFTARCSQLLVTAGGAGRSGGSHRRAQYLVGGLQGWLAMRLAADEGVACPQELAEFLSL